MKITDVELIVLEAPGAYDAPQGAEEAYGIKYLGIVRVRTDAGITGYADIETQPHIARAIVDAPSEGATPGFQGLRSVLIGEDPFEVERLWHKMYMASVYYGRRGAAIQVISGIDIALWDIIGKAVQKPVYKLLGGGLPRQSARLREHAVSLRTSRDGRGLPPVSRSGIHGGEVRLGRIRPGPRARYPAGGGGAAGAGAQARPADRHRLVRAPHSQGGHRPGAPPSALRAFFHRRAAEPGGLRRLRAS